MPSLEPFFFFFVSSRFPSRCMISLFRNTKELASSFKRVTFLCVTMLQRMVCFLALRGRVGIRGTALFVSFTEACVCSRNEVMRSKSRGSRFTLGVKCLDDAVTRGSSNRSINRSIGFLSPALFGYNESTNNPHFFASQVCAPSCISFGCLCLSWLFLCFLCPVLFCLFLLLFLLFIYTCIYHWYHRIFLRCFVISSFSCR